MYTLTLTKSERRAIDWVGNRYANGDDLYKVLVQCDQVGEVNDWDFDGDITFEIPEHAAWAIAEIDQECDGVWPCFADELRSKMFHFVNKIV